MTETICSPSLNDPFLRQHSVFQVKSPRAIHRALPCAVIENIYYQNIALFYKYFY